MRIALVLVVLAACADPFVSFPTRLSSGKHFQTVGDVTRATSQDGHHSVRIEHTCYSDRSHDSMFRLAPWHVISCIEFDTHEPGDGWVCNDGATASLCLGYDE